MQREEQAALLSSVLSGAVDAIVVMDSSGIVLLVNDACQRLFGYEPSELIGQNVNKLMPAPYRQEHDGYLAKYRETGQKRIIGIGREVSGRHKDGHEFPIHLAVSETHFDGRTLYTGIVRDISELKEVERQLELANERLETRVQERTEQLRQTQQDLVRSEKLATLGQVAGGIAHEIRNPLNAVKTSSYFLQMATDLPAEKLKEHLQRIDRQVDVINNVVTALTDVAKMPEPQAASYSIARLVEEALATAAPNESTKLIVNLPDELPCVWVDGRQVPIAISNLIRNAQDAMPDGGTLTISANSERESSEQPYPKPCLSLTISDTGTGIEPETLKNIMEPFFSTKARGMGLGLAITRAIIEKNAGTLHVKSRVGHGTSFCIELPLAPSSQ